MKTEGLQSAEGRSWQGTKRQCGHDRPVPSKKGPSEGPAGGGSPQAGRSENKGSPAAPTGPSGTEGGQKHRAGASGTERNGKEMAAWTGTSKGRCSAPPGLEHLGQADGTRNRAGLEHLGSTWEKQAPEWFIQGGHDSICTKVAEGDGLNSAVEARVRALGLERRDGRREASDRSVLN